MGEHDTWFDLLYYLPGYESLAEYAEHYLGRDEGSVVSWRFMMFGDTHFSMTPIMAAIAVGLFIVYCGIKFKRSLVRDGIIPPKGFGIRNFIELVLDGAFSIMSSIMGEKTAKRFFPFIGSLALFILFCNLMALIPGFAPPTDTLKTNLALALVVFLVTHIYGIAAQGTHYIYQFTGPKLGGFPWLFPFMIPIELISHLARPVSLSLRLMGNMAADHKVMFGFFALLPVVAPLPFLLLGLIVSIVQTLVFCTLSTIYIALALEHH